MGKTVPRNVIASIMDLATKKLASALVQQVGRVNPVCLPVRVGDLELHVSSSALKEDLIKMLPAIM